MVGVPPGAANPALLPTIQVPRDIRLLPHRLPKPDYSNEEAAAAPAPAAAAPKPVPAAAAAAPVAGVRSPSPRSTAAAPGGARPSSAARAGVAAGAGKTPHLQCCGSGLQPPVQHMQRPHCIMEVYNTGQSLPHAPGGTYIMQSLHTEHGRILASFSNSRTCAASWC